MVLTAEKATEIMFKRDGMVNDWSNPNHVKWAEEADEWMAKSVHRMTTGKKQ